MTLIFGKGLGIQEAKSSKDTKQTLEFCLVQNAEAFLFLTLAPKMEKKYDTIYSSYPIFLGSLVIFIIGPDSNLYVP